MINQIQILGDYNSSTKYLHNLFELNYKIKVSSGNLIHKHQYFPIEIIKQNPNTLFFITHRNFLRWVTSCFRNPHLFQNQKGFIKDSQDRTIVDMFNWKIGFTNEYNYGIQKAKQYYKTLGTTWYDNIIDYRNHKTKFYLKLLKFNNVIAINDFYLIDKIKTIKLLNKLTNKYNFKTKIQQKYNIPQYIYNRKQYIIKNQKLDSINKILNSKNELLINQKSIKL